MELWRRNLQSSVVQESESFNFPSSIVGGASKIVLDFLNKDACFELLTGGFALCQLSGQD